MNSYRFEAEIGSNDYNEKDHLPVVFASIIEDEALESHKEWEAWLDENGQKVEDYIKELSK